MTLIDGSWEKFIWGFKLKLETLIPLFSYPSHILAIKCVVISGPVVISGGADDFIKVYDITTSSEVRSLINQTGAITCILPPCKRFSGFAPVLSGSEDVTVSIYDADPFVHNKSIHAQRKSVNDLSIHKSGKLALSIGRGSCLAMSNLVSGRRSFCCRLNVEVSMIKFDTDGSKFFLVMEDKVRIHEAEDAKLKRILCDVVSANGMLLTGGEDCNVTAWDPTRGKVAYSIEKAHSNRLKGIAVMSSSTIDDVENSESPYLVAFASSDGVIRVWDVHMVKKEQPSPFAEANTKSRLTCLAGSSTKSQDWGENSVKQDEESE
ncbi:hypothetical protein MKX01_008567 [Papaver californicum]|nr:hypothetical protein MKX01_008567 [Papaver californicum]